MRNSSPKSKEMNIAMDRLQYLSQAAPLEKQLTFRELQNRPLGFQTAMPREPIGEAMNSLEFKSMEGAMYESAAYAGQMMRSEQMKDVLVAEAAARHGLPHDVLQEFVRQEGGLPLELQDTGARAQAFFAQEATREAQGQQLERMRQQQGIDQAAAIHAAAVGDHMSH